MSSATRHERTLGIVGASNSRDLGGYPTRDGQRTRWGRVYRSNKISALDDADLDRLDQLRIATLIDLRTRDERKADPSSWRSWPPNVTVSERLLATLTGRLGATPDDENATRAAMVAFYRDLPFLYESEYRAFFRAIAAGDTPVIIHCSAGKDRTGVGCALLLDFLGVPRDVVEADYVLTESLLVPSPRANPHGRAIEESIVGNAGRTRELGKMSPAMRAIMYRADPEYLAGMFDELEKRHHSVESYVTDVLGISEPEHARIRHVMLEAPADAPKATRPSTA